MKRIPTEKHEYSKWAARSALSLLQDPRSKLIKKDYFEKIYMTHQNLEKPFSIILTANYTLFQPVYDKSAC